MKISVRFNIVSKVLDIRLESIGAKRLLLRGEGDEQHSSLGIKFGFNLWVKTLFSCLNISNIIPDLDLTSKFKITLFDKEDYENDDNSLNFNIDTKRSGESDSSDYKPFQLAETTRLTCTSHFQNVTEFTFTSSQPLVYSPGDLFKVYPRNTKRDVDFVVSFFGWENIKARAISKLVSLRPDSTIPLHIKWLLHRHPKINIEYLLMSIVHISNYTPSQEFFEGLWFLTMNLKGKNNVIDLWIDKFKELSDDYDEYLYYCLRPKRRVVQILQEFSASSSFTHDLLGDIDPYWIFEIFSWIIPRPFSISSSMEVK